MDLKESKFDLEQAAGEVYEKAEQIYKGSEINQDTLTGVLHRFFKDTFTARQLQALEDYFEEQEKIFYDMYGGEENLQENKEVKEETVENTIPGLENYENIADSFDNYKAYEANFGPLVIVKVHKIYYIFKTTAQDYNDFIQYTTSKDYVNGWLYGAVQCKNRLLENKKVEEVNKQRIPTSELPDFCYSYNDTTGEIIVIKKGVEGYYPSEIKLNDTLVGNERKVEAEKLIKEQNEILGVTDDQRLQMELNSMFGWNDTKTESKETTSFEEIINMMERAQDYSELYNAASYIKDDNLRVDVEELIGQCEDDEDDVKTAYSLVTSDLLDNKRDELNEGLEIGGEDISIDSIFHFPNVIYAMQETCREAIMELQAEDKSSVTEKDVRVIYNELSKLEDIVNKYLEKANPDDNIIESKKVTEGYVIGLSTKTVRELAEDEVYDKYVQDINDGPVETLNITTTDNIEDALQIEEKFDAHTLADEIKERYPEWNSVVAFFK